jgi:DNA-binding NarL/FixJ family response regulator
MRTNERKLKIAVVEDNYFYNKILCRQLQTYTNVLAVENNFHFEIVSVTSAFDVSLFQSGEFDVAIIDYFLDENVLGTEVLKKIREQSSSCKALVISQSDNIVYKIKSNVEQFVEFVCKADRYAISQICYFVETAMEMKSESKR